MESKLKESIQVMKLNNKIIRIKNNKVMRKSSKEKLQISQSLQLCKVSKIN